MNTAADIYRALVAHSLPTAKHSLRVAKLARIVAKDLEHTAMGCEVAFSAGLVHDAGKLMIDTDVLHADRRLSDEQMSIMYRHPKQGYDIVSQIVKGPVGKSMLDAALHHHERIDGSGYPSGLDANHIPYMAKLIGACDYADAAITRRKWSDVELLLNTVCDELLDRLDISLDPNITTSVIRCILTPKIAHHIWGLNFEVECYDE